MCLDADKNCEDYFTTKLEYLSARKKAYDNLETKYNTFYYNLSNNQIDQLNGFLKYKNRESLSTFQTSVDQHQFNEFSEILDEYERLNKLEIDDSTPAQVELNKLCEERPWWVHYEKTMRMTSALAAKKDSNLISLSKELLRMGEDMRQREYDSRILRALEGIDQSLNRTTR